MQDPANAAAAAAAASYQPSYTTFPMLQAAAAAAAVMPPPPSQAPPPPPQLHDSEVNQQQQQHKDNTTLSPLSSGSTISPTGSPSLSKDIKVHSNSVVSIPDQSCSMVVDGTATTSTSASGSSVPVRVTRPPNAFLLFNKEMRKQLKESNPSMKVAEISKEIGERWKKLSATEKERYVNEANNIKEAQRAMHPNSMYIRRSKAELAKAGHYAKLKRKAMLVQQQQQQSIDDQLLGDDMATSSSSTASHSSNNSNHQGSMSTMFGPTAKEGKTRRDRKSVV